MRPLGTALVVTSLFTALALPPVVVCIGDDGHLALEAAAADCCDGGDSAGHTERDADCAPGCTDTQLGSPTVPRPADRQDDAAPPLLVAVIGPHPCVPLRAGHGAAAPAHGGVPPSPPRTQRTTVFLC